MAQKDKCQQDLRQICVRVCVANLEAEIGDESKNNEENPFHKRN